MKELGLSFCEQAALKRFVEIVVTGKTKLSSLKKTTQESRALVTAERNVLRDPRNHNMRFLHLFDSSASLGAKLGPRHYPLKQEHYDLKVVQRYNDRHSEASGDMKARKRLPRDFPVPGEFPTDKDPGAEGVRSDI